ncbi:MAG: molybdenum cofactor guanylyltransferase [Methanobacteriaceae archaeon]|jgi:molybdopterin-guanine dinucleotide biosynthesis protein A
MKSIIILCGGKSMRMGRDKGLILLNDKPMVLHVLDAIFGVADEIILVLRGPQQIKDYKNILEPYKSLKIVEDKIKDNGPLAGILTGFYNINSEYAQILPCDSPFISKNFVLKMFKIIEMNEYDAVIPIWDDGHTEPLHSIYKKSSLNTIEELINKGKRDVNSLISSLNVKFIDVEELDFTLRSFQNINTIKDLENE